MMNMIRVDVVSRDGAALVDANGEGTFAVSINQSGAITGYYIDANHVHHGFLRASNGTLTTFDAPDAGTGGGQGTTPLSIDQTEAATGFYIDESSLYHGFVRASDGTFTTFDVPDAGTGGGQGTL